MRLDQYQVYSVAEIERAIKLFDTTDLGWAEIAAILGRKSQNSLEATVCRYRRGARKSKRTVEIERTAAEIERLVESGITSVKAISNILGMNYSTTFYRMRNLGFDQETLREAAKLHAKSSPEKMRAEMRVAPAIGAERAAA